MNRKELATLLAQTHTTNISHSSHAASHQLSDPVPQSPPTRIRLRNPASPLSSRQLFQSRVRTLSDDGEAQVVDGISPSSPTRNTCELQHLSSLRVHVRSTTPTGPGRHHRVHSGSRNKHGYSSRGGRFSLAPVDPDFVVEERAAWNAESQSQPQPHSLNESRPSANCGHAYDGNVNTMPILSTGEHNLSSPPLLLQGNPQLVHFGPLSASNDSCDRPKTSRGPTDDSNLTRIPGAFPDSNSQRNATAARRSKFNEGSMNDRSTAISSTWDDYGPRLSESSRDASVDDSDSDATPRPSRLSRDSDCSSDVSEFRPRPTTPSTIKHTISRLGSHFRSTSSSTNPGPVGASENPVLGQKKENPKAQGLRKSISNWNFHSLGEKMKFFGKSSHDLGESPPKKLDDPDLLLLSDRKRKAEAAYAQQFGTKKQKSNDGIPIDDKRSSIPAPPRTIKKRSTSVQRSLTPATVRRRRNASPATGSQPNDPTEIFSDGDIDRRKRPTRRELEKENQQLRVMLREKEQQRSASMVRSASKSNVHLPLESEQIPPVPHSKPVITPPRHATAGFAIGKQQKKQHFQNIPPVPPLPSRAALANLGTGNAARSRNGSATIASQFSQNSSHFGATETGTIKRVGGGLPRPVSTISEGEESAPADENVSGLEFGLLPGLRPSPRKDDWQWPDDVF